MENLTDVFFKEAVRNARRLYEEASGILREGLSFSVEERFYKAGSRYCEVEDRCREQIRNATKGARTEAAHARAETRVRALWADELREAERELVAACRELEKSKIKL